MRRLLLLLVLLPLWAHASQRVLTSADLPFRASTNYDTITFSGTKITSATHGIVVTGTGVVINLGTDTLVFGTGGGDNNIGILINRRLSTQSQNNVTIKGGHIVHGGGANSDGNTCLALAGCWGVLIDSVSMYVAGTNGHCISRSPEGISIAGYTSWNSSNAKIEIRGGVYYSDVWGYSSRCQYDGAVIHLNTPSTDKLGNDWTFKVHHVVVRNAPGQGIVLAGGKNFAYYDTVTVDAHNGMYTYPSDNFCHGSSNAFCMMTSWSWPGSEFHHNCLLAGTARAGSDGGFEIEGTSATVDDPAKWHHNYINVHRGPGEYYGSLTAKGFKIRPFPYESSADPNVGVHIYDNDIHVYSKNNWTVEPSYGPSASGFYIFSHLFGEIDEGITIERNRIRAIVLDDTERPLPGGDAPEIEANGFKVMGNETYDNFTVRHNRIESNHQMYRFGGFDGGGDSWTFYGDTCIAIDTANGPDNKVSLFVGSRDGAASRCCNVVLDAQWSPSGLEYDFDFAPGSGSKSSSVKRTLKVYVQGTNGLPVVGAAVTVRNHYNQQVVSGSTNTGGEVSGVVTYCYQSYSGTDSTAFNPFVITASKDGQNAQVSNFNVSSAAEGGTLLLTLNLIGTGEWGGGGEAPDTTPPARIEDLGTSN